MPVRIERYEELEPGEFDRLPDPKPQAQVAPLVRGGGTHTGHIDDGCVLPGGDHASSRSWASVACRGRRLA